MHRAQARRVPLKFRYHHDARVGWGAVGGETVVLTDQMDQLKTTSAAKGEVIGEKSITQLPLPSRNFQQLLALSPGTVAGLSNNTELGRGDVNISVNGQRSTSNNVSVNGTEHPGRLDRRPEHCRDQ